METQIHENEDRMVQPEFWNDLEEAQKVIDSNNHIKKIVDGFREIESAVEDIELSHELLKEENDEDMREMIEENVRETRKKINAFELNILLDDEHDELSAILELHPGAGGTT